MSYENINLWFARKENNEIITIDNINQQNKRDKYYCPICGSEVIPKAIKEDSVMTPHFAHIDRSKCDGESMIHFWIKNKLIEKGGRFNVKLDSEIKECVCRDVLIEQEYKTEFGTYRPDITIITETNETVYFEVANTNKKKIEEYLDMWIELENIVVEVDTKDLMNGNSIKEFKSLFYKGKCFNVNNQERDYYETIGSIKIGYKEGIYTKDELESVNWLWRDINKYIKNEIEIDVISNEIQLIENDRIRNMIVSVLRKPICNQIIKDYTDYNIKLIEDESKLYDNYTFQATKMRLVYDRIYKGCNVDIFYKRNLVCSGVIKYGDLKSRFDNILENIKYKIYVVDCNKHLKDMFGENNYNKSSLNYFYTIHTNKHKMYLNNFNKDLIKSKGEYIVLNNKSYEDIIYELQEYISRQIKINNNMKSQKEELIKIENYIRNDTKLTRSIVLKKSEYKKDNPFYCYFRIDELYSITTYDCKTDTIITDIQYYIKSIKQHIMDKVVEDMNRRYKIIKNTGWTMSNIREDEEVVILNDYKHYFYKYKIPCELESEEEIYNYIINKNGDYIRSCVYEGIKK